MRRPERQASEASPISALARRVDRGVEGDLEGGELGDVGIRNGSTGSPSIQVNKA